MALRRVLLARPHDFVVETMLEFLTRNGFEAVPVTRDEDLLPELEQPLHGAVISTAVVSSVHASVRDVYQAVRAAKPTLPLAFASLAGVDAMRGLAQSELGKQAEALSFLDVVEASSGHAHLGAGDTVLCLPRDVLTDPKLGPLADRLLTAHFARAR